MQPADIIKSMPLEEISHLEPIQLAPIDLPLLEEFNIELEPFEVPEL